MTDEDSVVDTSVVDAEGISQFPVSLHGYGIPQEGEDQDSIANKIKEKLLRLRRPSLMVPLKRHQAWAQGYGKRQQDWFATYGKKDGGTLSEAHHRVQRETLPKRQNGWNIGYGRK